MSRRKIALSFDAIILAAALVAMPCGAQQKIVLDGSTGMIPLATALAQSYRQLTPAPLVEIGHGLGTGARLKAVAEGRIDIALASHGVVASELEKNGLRSIEVAKGAIVFAVNASVPLAGLTDQQACDLFSGKTARWSALQGPDVAVVVMTRPQTEVDPEVLRAKVACFKDLRETVAARVMPRSSDMAKALSDTPNAVGVTSMTVVEQSGGRVRALELNGLAPSTDNVKAGRYFLTRDFLFVVKTSPSPAVAHFLEYVRSAQGAAVLLGSGAIPMQ
jgi:phosphate transport system substrate-binding protein